MPYGDVLTGRRWIAERVVSRIRSSLNCKLIDIADNSAGAGQPYESTKVQGMPTMRKTKNASDRQKIGLYVT
jgi:hypothetical protein